MSIPAHRRAAGLLVLALSTSTAEAFSFNIANTPTQCGNLSVSISGSGTPPYSILIIPFGPSPLPNSIEARKIESQNSSDTTITFPINYPADSQFVTVVSDSSGFGTGGTSGAVTVQASSDSSCFSSTTSVSPEFFFSVSPNGALTQCEQSRLWWTPSDVQGTPYFYGIIPGGDSFSIPEANINTTTGEGQGFPWTVDVRVYTTVMLVASDNRGEGSGGSGLYSVNPNPSNDASCLSNSSPSSTAGSPAGGSYPTTTGESTSSTSGSSSSGSGSGSNSGSGSSTNIGAIVGGVIGGVFGALAILLVGLFFVRRRRQSKKYRREGDPVDLLQQNGDGGGDSPTGGEAHALPRWYEPEPYHVPPSTTTGASSVAGGAALGAAGVGAAAAEGRPSMERLNTTPGPSASEAGTSTTGMSGATRKSPLPPSLRPVNVIQHDDAGTAEGAEEGEGDTVELPPAYNNIRR